MLHELESEVSSPEGVGVASVGRPREDVVGASQLLDIHQPLEDWVVDEVPDELRERDVLIVDGIIDRPGIGVNYSHPACRNIGIGGLRRRSDRFLV